MITAANTAHRRLLVPIFIFQVGLDKIISTQEQVGGLQEQLTAMEPVLIQTQADVEVMIVNIIKDKEEAGKTQNEARKTFMLMYKYSTGSATGCYRRGRNFQTEEEDLSVYPTGVVHGGNSFSRPEYIVLKSTEPIPICSVVYSAWQIPRPLLIAHNAFSKQTGYILSRYFLL